MAQYLIQSETLTNIAAGIRNITGETSAITPDGMVNNLYGIHAEVDAQADLVAQLNEKFKGRAIAFTIMDIIGGRHVYAAEKGMTWEEWVNSNYNLSSGFKILSSGVVTSSSFIEVCYGEVINNGYVYKEEIIDHGGKYRCFAGGGSD